MKQQVAIYLRLSQEDVDKRTSKVKDESNSISAQRILITRHLDLNPVLCNLPRLEFCDDGYSGTSFDRPEFSRMIELVKRGEISCIVVKDYCAIIGLNQKGLGNQGVSGLVSSFLT